MKADCESLEASDQRLSKECNRHDQDGEKKNSKQDRRKLASTSDKLLQPAVSRVAGNRNGQSPSDYCDKGAQNKEAGGDKQGDKGKVNENFENATQVRLLGRRLARGNVGSPSPIMAGSLVQLLLRLPAPS
jgi:hypothetical protein